VLKLDILLAPFAGVGRVCEGTTDIPRLYRIRMQQLRSSGAGYPPFFSSVSAILIHAIAVAPESRDPNANRCRLLKRSDTHARIIGLAYVKYALCPIGAAVCRRLCHGVGALASRVDPSLFRYVPVSRYHPDSARRLSDWRRGRRFPLAIAGAPDVRPSGPPVLPPAEAMSPAPDNLPAAGFLTGLVAHQDLDAPKHA